MCRLPPWTRVPESSKMKSCGPSDIISAALLYARRSPPSPAGGWAGVCTHGDRRSEVSTARAVTCCSRKWWPWVWAGPTIPILVPGPLGTSSRKYGRPGVDWVHGWLWIRAAELLTVKSRVTSLSGTVSSHTWSKQRQCEETLPAFSSARSFCG